MLHIPGVRKKRGKVNSIFLTTWLIMKKRVLECMGKKEQANGKLKLEMTLVGSDD